MTPEIVGNTTSKAQAVILVAEDNDSNYLLIQEILKNQNFELLRAANGLEAIKIAQNRSDIDLVLMDIRMPILSGYDASKRISKMRPELPIIMQSAFAMRMDMDEAREAGCQSFITKPIEPLKLISLVNQFLNIEDQGY